MAKYSIIREFWEFAKVRKKYWLLPIIIIVGALAVLIIQGGPASPFIYTVF